MRTDELAESRIDIIPVGEDAFRSIIPTVFDRLTFTDTKIEDETRTATAWKTINAPDAYFGAQQRSHALIRWQPIPGRPEETTIYASVFDDFGANRRLNEAKTQELGELIQAEVKRYTESLPPKSREQTPHDPVSPPGKPFECLYTGTLRDYSGCATATDPGIARLMAGTLPLGIYWFGFDDRPPSAGTPLYMSKFSNGGKMEYNGVLVCAPQNSGKTMLIKRWARAAMHANPSYGVLIIDVKGKLRADLADKLVGDVYTFSTDPLDDASDRINFLDGPTGLNAVDTDRIRQLATALLPSRGFVEKGGVDEYHYRNQVVWLTAFIHILKLAQYYEPDWFVDYEGKRRNVDLADLYNLLRDENLLLDYFKKLLVKEKAKADDDERQKAADLGPLRGLDFWFSEIAIMLDPDKFNIGQRMVKDTYGSYTIALTTALQPFAPKGTMHKRTSAAEPGPGRMFDIETVLSEPGKPVTVIIAARQQDLQTAEAVLALLIKRMQWFLFSRMTQPDAGDRPILMLLDETRRIRDFDAAEFITFAREAKAGCVIVYQSLDQIGLREKIVEVLENIGTQIYLGSLIGNTARYFIDMLPKRTRPVVSRQTVRSLNTEMSNTTIGHEQVDYLSTADLYRLPGGRYPALIHVNDMPRGKPFFVDMTEGAP
jgi:Type IV secretory system Conjugative DNA transfer